MPDRIVNCPTCGYRTTAPEPTEQRGAGLHAAAVEAVEPGESIHYRDLTHRLELAGYTIGGKNPAATLLAVLGRAPEFAAHGSRSGNYQRAPL